MSANWSRNATLLADVLRDAEYGCTVTVDDVAQTIVVVDSDGVTVAGPSLDDVAAYFAHVQSLQVVYAEAA